MGRIIVDEETAEIIGEYKPKLKHKHSNIAFTKFFYHPMENFLLAFVFKIGEEMDRGNKITIGKTFKESFIESHDRTLEASKLLVKSLVEDEVLLRIGRGRFFVNPFMFAKVQSAELSRLRKEYREAECTYS